MANNPRVTVLPGKPNDLSFFTNPPASPPSLVIEARSLSLTVTPSSSPPVVHVPSLPPGGVLTLTGEPMEVVLGDLRLEVVRGGGETVVRWREVGDPLRHRAAWDVILASGGAEA